MNDPEFIMLRNRFIIGLVAALVFTIPLTFFFINKLGDKPSKILDGISNQETMLLLVTEQDCNSCKNVENILKENNVSYSVLNKDKESKYSQILKKLDFTQSDATPPTIIYIVDGKVYSSLVETEETKVLSYIENNNLISTK